AAACLCPARAGAAAAKLRGLQSAYREVDVEVQERPKYGPGRPSATQPRVVKALRYGVQVTLHERAEVIARKRQEAGCFVLLTNVPTVGFCQLVEAETLIERMDSLSCPFLYLKPPASFP